MQVQPNSYIRSWKRAFDFTFALMGLVLLCIPMLLIAAAVWVCSGGPVIFSQARVGRHGRVFLIRKFRTMRQSSTEGSTVTIGGDSRVTPVGSVLRNWKLDELPQLWNVLVGQMSFVGPRPDVPGFADSLSDEDSRILDLRPGITGPATLFYRDEEKLLAQVSDPVSYNREVIFPHKVRLNLDYIDRCSLGTDLSCIWQTVIPMRGEDTNA